MSQSTPSRVFSAPSGISDTSDDESDVGPSFSIQAPTGFSDSSDSDDEEVTSAPVVVRIVPPTRAELALHELEKGLQQQMMALALTDIADFQSKWRAIERQEQEDYREVENLMRQTWAVIAEGEAARQESLRLGQEKLMSGLQQAHTSQAQAMERKAAAAKQAEEEKQRRLLEERRRVEEEEQRRAEIAALKAEHEAARKKQEEQQHRQEEEAKQAEARRQEAETQQAMADAQSRDESADRRARSAGASTSAQGVQISEQAVAFERTCREALASAQEAAKKLDADPEQKAEKRAMYRKANSFMTKLGGTQEQVNVKSAQIIELLNSISGPLKAFAMMTLSRLLLNLAEEGNSRFPVAEVAVLVCNRHQEMLPILLGRLHEECPLAVPKSIVRLPNESKDAFLKRWAFQRREVLDPETKQLKQGWEDVEQFLERLTTHLQFYAAFCQSDSQTAHGMGAAWEYLSRLLNALPPSRFTAFALLAFVEIAGYKMYHTYRAQFVKLLVYIDRHFVDDIIQQELEDARSAVRRLRLYLQSSEFMKEPVGRALDMYDESSTFRA